MSRQISLTIFSFCKTFCPKCEVTEFSITETREWSGGLHKGREFALILIGSSTFPKQMEGRRMTKFPSVVSVFAATTLPGSYLALAHQHAQQHPPQTHPITF